MPVVRQVIKEFCPHKYGEGENPAWALPVNTARLQSPLSRAIVATSSQFSLEQVLPWSKFGNQGSFSRGPDLPAALKWVHLQVLHEHSQLH